MKKILILNNSHSEIDIIKNLLKFKKYKIFTTGNVKPFIKKNINHIKIDYTKIRFIKKIVHDKKIDLVIPCANDLGLYSANKIKKNNLIDKKKNLDILLNKYNFRKYYKKIPYYQLREKKKYISKFPLLLKKKISSGVKNIRKINNLGEINGIKLKNSDFFLEKIIDGTDHGVFTIIKKSKIIFSFFDSEQRFINPYTVSSTSSKNNLPTNIQKKFLKEIIKITQELKLVDGILHFQIKYKKKQKKIYIIEITRRIPGDRYLKFVEYASGVNVCKLYIELYAKTKLLQQGHKKKNHILRKVIFSKKNGILTTVVFDKKIKKRIVELTFVTKKGEVIKDYINQRIAIIFLKFKKKSILRDYTKNIDKYIKVVLK